jgi:hypothetical protein
MFIFTTPSFRASAMSSAGIPIKHHRRVSRSQAARRHLKAVAVIKMKHDRNTRLFCQSTNHCSHYPSRTLLQIVRAGLKHYRSSLFVCRHNARSRHFKALEVKFFRCTGKIPLSTEIFS